MKKLFALATLLALPFLNSGGYWDFDRAEKEGLPPTYMFGREENTFNGQLNRQCEGGACKANNWILNQL